MQPSVVILSVLLAASAGLCRAASYTLLSGNVSCVLSIGDEALSHDGEILSSIEAAFPAGHALEMPSPGEIAACFKGFSLAEGFESAEVESGGKTTKRFEFRLLPDGKAAEWRLGPFPVELLSPDGKLLSSEATRAVSIPLAPLPEPDSEIRLDAKKKFVPPSARTVLGFAALLALCAGAVYAACALAGRLARRMRLAKMSPARRALLELDELLARQLPVRGLFKDYYIELTHVVRRYVERKYRLRAPKLTTEEFLAQATGSGRFTDGTVRFLGDFLSAADMVKFAASEATPSMADSAASLARRYISEDETSTPAGEEK